MVIKALLILIIGLSPLLFSFWFIRHAEARDQERMRLALESFANRGLSGLRTDPDQRYIEGLGFIIGDLTCRFNARSSQLRCAVNPSGPCIGCSQYEPRLLEETETGH